MSSTRGADRSKSTRGRWTALAASPRAGHAPLRVWPLRIGVLALLVALLAVELALDLVGGTPASAEHDYSTHPIPRGTSGPTTPA